MSSIILCPQCRQKLKVPDSAIGKTNRCPACKALIPPDEESLAEADDFEGDEPPPSRAVKTTAPPRAASARSSRDNKPEEDEEPAEEEVVRRRPARRGRSVRRSSSTGLIIGLVIGGVVLLLLVAGTGAGLLIYFLRNKSTIAESEWKSFSPPGGDCTVLMPGTPNHQPMPTLGGMINKYLIERTTDKTLFAVAFIQLGVDQLPANILEIAAKAERTEMAKRLNGTIASESDTTLGQIPGREFQITAPDGGVLIERLYAAKIGGGHRVYIVAGGYTSKNNKGDVERFFASFKIDASAAPPTYGPAEAGMPQMPAFNPPRIAPQPMPPRIMPQPNPPRTIPQPNPPRVGPQPQLPMGPRRGR